NSIMREPISVEPVKETFRTSAWVTRASPILAPQPGSTWSAPGGRPASIAIRPNIRAVSGDREAGFSTTVLPAASAGATFQQAIGKGKFQGTMAATTPIDWR